MPAMLTGQRVPFAISFTTDAGVPAPIQSIEWSVSDATAIRVDTTGTDGVTGFVVAVGVNDTTEPADVLYDADVDMGPGVRHLTGKNLPTDRFVVSQNPATMASAGVLTFGAAEDVPVATA